MDPTNNLIRIYLFTDLKIYSVMDLGEKLNVGHLLPDSPHTQIEVIRSWSSREKSEGFANSFIFVGPIEEISVAAMDGG